MGQSTETKTTTSGPARPELVRPTEGRVVAGVARGLAEPLAITPWIVRAVFIVTTFLGGLGVALYVAGWALIRSEDEATSAAERFFDDVSSGRSWFGVGLIFVAALILLDNLTFLSGGVVWAVGLLVVGVLLYTGHIPTAAERQTDPKDRSRPLTTAGQETRSADTPDDGGTPPTPAPTPPILPPSASKPRERSILGRLTIGIMLVSMGALAILDNIDSVSIDAGPRHYLALAVVVLGIGLLVGTFAGKARWLIIVGAILVPTLMFSPLLEYDWTSENFDGYFAPTSFSQVEELYAQDVGNLVIDLTSLPWDGRTIELDARVDAGILEIWLPDGVGVTGEASVELGRVTAPGRASVGLGSPRLVFDETGDLGTVQLDAEVEVGSIEIRR